MKHERDGGTVTVHFERDFNLLTARHLRQCAQGAEHVRVDLSRVALVDTEALAALHELQEGGTRITLFDPPDLFFEIIEVLELEDVFDVEVAAG